MSDDESIELPFNIDYRPLIGTTREQRDAMVEAAITVLTAGASDEAREMTRHHFNQLRNPNSGFNASIESIDGDADPAAVASLSMIISIIMFEQTGGDPR